MGCYVIASSRCCVHEPARNCYDLTYEHLFGQAPYRYPHPIRASPTRSASRHQPVHERHLGTLTRNDGLGDGSNCRVRTGI